MGVESPQFKTWEELGPEAFAMELAEPGPDGAIRLRLDDYHHRVAIHPGVSDRIRYIGWELPTASEVDGAAAVLTNARIAVESATPEECEERQVERMIHFKDPAGLRHELFSGALRLFKSFTAPRRFGGFVTGSQGLGHIVVLIPDTDAEDQFVRGILGFKLTDSVSLPIGLARFYHVNPRHHSLATLPSPSSRGLHHIMIQVADLDDVGIAYDRAQACQDLRLTLTLGRHSTDQMVSFQVRTPSGFDIEYGWGAIMLDEHWVATRSPAPAEIWGHRWLDDVGPITALEPVSKTVPNTGADAAFQH